MRIKGFNATSVYGYLNFDINFHDDKNFLVGGNGSGKTTALKLINALITPSFRELINIPFKDCSLLLAFEGEEIYILAYEKDENIILGISNCEFEIELPSNSSSDMDFITRKEDRFEELLEDLTHKYTSHPVIDAISKISSPIFLGLDRRIGFTNSHPGAPLTGFLMLNHPCIPRVNATWI